MKTLFQHQYLPFKEYLNERVLTEEKHFNFFITSGPECDLELETDVHGLMNNLSSDRLVEYSCYLEENSVLEIFTTKVNGYQNKDGIKFGLRTRNTAEKIFQNENLRDYLGIALLAKTKSETDVFLIEDLLKTSGYQITNKRLTIDGSSYRITKKYGYFLISSSFMITTSYNKAENDRMYHLLHSFIS